MIEPFRVSSTEAIRASVASLPDAGRRDLATAMQALSQLVAVQDALGEQFDQSTVEVFGQGAVLLYYRVVARGPAADGRVCLVSRVAPGPLVTVVVRCDPVVRGPDVAPADGGAGNPQVVAVDAVG